MLDYLKIAWRNLRRNKVRTFISILAITVVVMIVVFSRGLILGFTGSFSDEVINNTSGHVRVINQEYQNREYLMSLEYPVDGFQGQGLDNMLTEMEKEDEIDYLLPRIRFGALYSGEEDLTNCIGIGADFVREEDHGILREDLTAGRMPESGDEILVGKGLLDKFEAEPGQTVTLMFSDAFHSFRGRTFTVVGVFESGFSMFDDNMFYLPLETAQRILGLEEQATEILTFGETRAQSTEIEEQLSSLFAGYNEEDRYIALHWLEADPFLALVDEMDIMYDFIYIGFVLLGGIIVASTMIMIIRERKTEIGMMSALGLKGRDIMKIFTFEGAFMGIIGSLLGTVGGGVLNYYFSLEGIPVQPLAELVEEMEFLFEPVFYPVYNLENLIYSFVLGVIVVILACLYPARKAAKMEPVEALQVDE